MEPFSLAKRPGHCCRTLASTIAAVIVSGVISGKRCVSGANRRACPKIDLEKLLHVQGAILWLPCTILLFCRVARAYTEAEQSAHRQPDGF